MITQFADEYPSQLTADYFIAEITNLQQIINRRKESDRGDCCTYSVMYIACVMPLRNWTS